MNRCQPVEAKIKTTFLAVSSVALRTYKHPSTGKVNIFYRVLGGSPGLVVMGRDSCSKGRGFESQHCILDGHFFTYICCKNCDEVCLKRPKINEKEAGVGPFKPPPFLPKLSQNPSGNTHCWESITEQLVSSFTSLDSAASLHTKNNIFSCLVKSSLVKRETSCTVILPPTLSVLLIILSFTLRLWREVIRVPFERILRFLLL